MMDLPITSFVLIVGAWLVKAFGGESQRDIGWEMFRKYGIRSVAYRMEERSPDLAETKRLRRAGTASWLAGGLVLAAIYAWMLGFP